MLEWPEYQLQDDLEVTFVKIQYRETSSTAAQSGSTLHVHHSRTWNTLDEDLDPSTTSYVVSGLQPGIYNLSAYCTYPSYFGREGQGIVMSRPMFVCW